MRTRAESRVNDIDNNYIRFVFPFQILTNALTTRVRMGRRALIVREATSASAQRALRERIAQKVITSFDIYFKQSTLCPLT